MKKYKIIVLAMLACVSLKSWAQEEGNIAGKVVDKLGNPIEGVLISVENNPECIIFGESGCLSG